MPAIATKADIFEQLTALGEPTRARLLLLLERQELTVSELCAVLQAPQSTTSRHLKSLAEAGWIASRPEGTKRFYRMDRDALPDGRRRLWLTVRGEVTGGPAAAQDRSRLASVLALRRSRSQEFFSSEAGQWDRLRDELFGPGFFLAALPALLDPDAVLGDLGCGTGQLAEAMAPFAARVVAVDSSDAMLAEARRRLAGRANVRVLQGDLETLPLDDGELDAAVLALVLHHVPEPRRALREVARVLRPGGRALIIDMLPHDREEWAAQMGHVWLGFGEETIAGHFAACGFGPARFTALPAEPAARGPALFAAAARRQDARLSADEGPRKMQ